MPLRKGKCYSKSDRPPYTRKSRVRTKSYIKGAPQTRISKFMMGDLEGFQDEKYKCCVELVMDEKVQIRDNALEASRTLINKELEKKLKGNYFFVVAAYPHQILREKKILSGAGADRLSTGMQLAFGKPIGLAARVQEGNSVFRVFCNKNAINVAKEALKKVKSKIPGKKRIVVRSLK